MKLYYAETNNPRKVCVVARYLGTPLEYVRLDLAKGETRTPQFLAENPNGKVPLLVEADGRRLSESNAIMYRLSELAGSDLWPRDERQADVLRWLFWDADHFGRQAGRLYFEHVVKPSILGILQPDAAAVEEALRQFRVYAAVLEDHLGSRSYIVADTLSVADFALGASLPYAEAARIPLGEFPAIARWHDRLNALSAWREPFPARH